MAFGSLKAAFAAFFVVGAISILWLGLRKAQGVDIVRLAVLFTGNDISKKFVELRRLTPVRRVSAVSTSQAWPEELQAFPYQKSIPSLGVTIEEHLRRTHTQGLLAIRSGTIVSEKYWNGHDSSTKFTSWSVAKSFVSGLVGIAHDRGYIHSVDDKVTKYLPEFEGTGFSDATIKNLLQMSSGLDFNENYDEFLPDIKKMFIAVYLFGIPIESYLKTLRAGRSPATLNDYQSPNTQMLGLLLTRVTGRTVSDLLETEIWHPTGAAEDAYWNLDRSNGVELSYCCLSATLRDFARYGVLFSQGGNWKGNQILSEKWVRESTVPSEPYLQPGKIPSVSLGYQYQWWVPQHSNGEFLAIGVWGQFIYIDSINKIVIVKVSTNPEFERSYDAEVAAFRVLKDYFVSNM